MLFQDRVTDLLLWRRISDKGWQYKRGERLAGSFLLYKVKEIKYNVGQMMRIFPLYEREEFRP